MADRSKINAGIQQWNAGPGQFMQNWHNGQRPAAPVDPATGSLLPNLLGENNQPIDSIAGNGVFRPGQGNDGAWGATIGGESMGTSNQQALGPYNEPLAPPGGGEEQRWIANALTEWLHGSAKGAAGGWGSR